MRAGALTGVLLSIPANLWTVCQTVNANEAFSIKWLEWKTVLKLSVDGSISSLLVVAVATDNLAG